MTTLNLTISEQRKHDRELLRRLAQSPRPLSFAAHFDHLEVRWASEALDRLLVAGYVREMPGGELAITAQGLAAAQAA